MINAIEFDKNDPCPVYLLRGGCAYLKDGVIGALKSLIPEDMTEVDYLRFDDEAKIPELLAAADTFSFLGGKKLIVYKAPSLSKLAEADKASLLAYCKNPCDGTILVIDDEGQIFKFLEKHAEIIHCEPPNEAFVQRWLKNLLTAKGCGIESSALDTLIRYAGADMTRLNIEAAKLAAFADGREIRFADVAACVVPETEMQVFELTDSLSRRDSKNSVRIYNALLDRGEAPAFLLSIITNQFRRILHTMLSDLTDAELAVFFKIKEYPIVLARRTSKNFTKLKIKKIVDQLTLSEYLFKSGAVGEKAALEMAFAYLLCA
ncbi:MAG: DNA polymerase III subunit delta [Clostridiales bacterium]|nr:DNA polymerase III subunit delta [Clostridiales bacterium]